MTKAKFADLEDELHSRAAEIAQYSDFGTSGYRTGLRLLLRAFDQDATFTEVGFNFAYGTVLGTLVARLYAQRGIADAPPAHAPPIRAPLVITGIPRTGTTALHKLLSMDPQFQGLEHWLTDYPMIRPPRATWPANPAFQASVAGLDAFFAAMPQMRKAHDMVADEVGECLDILRQSFVSNRFGSAINVPSYDEWFFAQSEIPSYHRYADVLRLIGTAEPQKRWLLKNPGHIAQLEALFAVFPDALVIHTHRDPVAAIPSLCSTLYMARAMYEGEHTERRLIGPRESSYWRTALDSAAKTLNAIYTNDHGFRASTWRFCQDKVTPVVLALLIYILSLNHDLYKKISEYHTTRRILKRWPDAELAATLGKPLPQKPLISLPDGLVPTPHAIETHASTP